MEVVPSGHTVFQISKTISCFNAPCIKGGLFWDADSERPLKALLLGSIDGG
jgi:hypothetical protein